MWVIGIIISYLLLMEIIMAFDFHDLNSMSVDQYRL